MLMTDLIHKKRIGQKLSEEEISWMIQSYMNLQIPDYQMSAFLMAVMYNGMDYEETYFLTKAMKESGEFLDLSHIHGIKVDKHSTGGVGDKTSLVLAPLIASLGVNMVKMSGRGLGHTGGTLDKLESIPGFNVSLTPEQMTQQLKDIHLVIVGQTDKLTPADRRLYALRDVTDTVSSIPLIAASIMSKKLSIDTDCILLDVKYGSGAFMKTKEVAKKLADTMIAIGKAFNKNVDAIISNMEEPLGRTIGNNLEVIEAIQTLKGKGPVDFTELCLECGEKLLLMSHVAPTKDKAREMLIQQIHNGQALEYFKKMVTYQQGDVSYIDDIHKFPVSNYKIHFKTKKEGFITKIDAYNLGLISMHLGGGRKVKEEQIQPEVGLVLNAKVGDYVKSGDELLTIHTNFVLDKSLYDSIWKSYVIEK